MEIHKPATFSDAIDAIGMGPFQSRLLLVLGMPRSTTEIHTPPTFFGCDRCDWHMEPFQSRLLLVFGMAWLVDAIEIVVITFVLDDVAVTFQLGSSTKGLVGSASFFGTLFGAMFWSVYADKRGRRSTFTLSLACIFAGGLASALAPSFHVLMIFRAIVGFGIGGSMPVTTLIVSELLPTSYRATAQCRLSGLFWAAGFISAPLVGLVLSRALGSGREEAMWRWFLGLAAMPGAMSLVAYRLIPESPRYLSVVGRHDEAVEVLEEIARVNGVTNVLGMELSQVTNDDERVALVIEPSAIDLTGRENRAGAGDIRELFRTPTLRRATISIWMVWFFLPTSFYGLTFVLPEYYKEIFGQTESFVYIFSAVLGVVMVPATLLAMWLCSEDQFGRVATMKWSCFATAVLILLMALSYGTPALFLPVSIVTAFGFGVPMVVIIVVTPELFTTKHRAVAMCGAVVSGRIGSMLTPILAEVLYDEGPTWPLAVFGPSMILAAVFSGMIPFETAGRKLDDIDSRIAEAGRTL